MTILVTDLVVWSDYSLIPPFIFSFQVPIVHKKEEIFQALNDYNVPHSRATWLIRMSNAYSVAIAEASKKLKRAAMPDPHTGSVLTCLLTCDIHMCNTEYQLRSLSVPASKSDIIWYVLALKYFCRPQKVF